MGINLNNRLRGVFTKGSFWKGHIIKRKEVKRVSNSTTLTQGGMI
jgi:hypothetical protein